MTLVLEEGEWVRIKGEAGRYRVMRAEPSEHDGSITLYGGDKDPRGRRGYRSVLPERLLRASDMHKTRQEREAKTDG
jgi:hypothetical protein